MKRLHLYLCLIPFIGLSTVAQANCIEECPYATECKNNNRAVELLDLQNRAAEQIIEIENILDLLCNHLTTAKINNKDSVCREVELLREFIKNIGQGNIYELDEEGLVHLLEINELLIGHLAQHISGDLNGLCDFDITAYKKKRSIMAFPNPREHYKTFMTELRERYDQVHDKIKEVWKKAKELNLNSFNRAIRAVENFACSYHIDTIAKRGWPYVLCGLYLLRQQKDADIEKWNNPIVGKLKKIVGSPKEKKPSVRIVPSKTMTGKEQENWIKDNDYKVEKTSDGRDCGFLRNLSISLTDGDLAKISLTAFFLSRLQQDATELSEWLQQKWNTIHAKLIGETA